MPTQLASRLAKGEVILIDGGTGSEIERCGAEMSEIVWSGAAALSYPQIIQRVHEQYIASGAEVIIANTYACSYHLLDRAGLGHEFENLNRTGIELALAARDAMAGSDVAVAGSISTTEMDGQMPAVGDARATTSTRLESRPRQAPT